jgi:hypothetical protein
MGNRAFIVSEPYGEENVGIYVQWNGGQESIEGFCRAAKELGYRSPADDDSYSLARLVQVISNFFGIDGLSIGIGTGSRLAGAADDNGIWTIGKDWQIVSHLTSEGVMIPLEPLTPGQEEKAQAVHHDAVAKTRAVAPEEKAN